MRTADNGNFTQLAAVLDKRLQTAVPLVLAIDGRCGSGKTTLASQLAHEYGGSIVHMDDFFLRPVQRNAKRLAQPGGNIDYERFETEVIPHLYEKKGGFSYRRYDCSVRELTEEIQVKRTNLIIVEGVYSCHPRFFVRNELKSVSFSGFGERDVYDFKVFLNIDVKKQQERILKRNGKDMYERFMKEWIPKEELYFTTFRIKEKCDLVLEAE